MYAQHFRLTGEAFSLTPDPACVYLSPGHAEALAALTVGLQGRRGLLVMVGEVGMGKTTLLYSLLSAIGTEIRTAYVANTTLSLDEMLRAALTDFQVACEGRDRLQLLEALDAFLLQCAEEGTTAALVIDEAQNLSEEAFENIRLLSNFESFTSKLLQIVLVGQPELDTKLRSPNLRQVAERVAVRCHINPLTRNESRKYIAHRLECAGGSLDLFTRGALRLVVGHAQGIPRRINILCHNALLFAYGNGADRVAETHVRAAVREWQGQGLITLGRQQSGPITRQAAGVLSRQRLWWQPALATTAAALLIVGAVAGMHRNNAAPEVAAAPSVETDAPKGEPSDSAAGSARPEDDHAVTALSFPNMLSVKTLCETSPVLDRCASDTSSEKAPPFRTLSVPQRADATSLARRIYGQVTPEIVGRTKDANPRLKDMNDILAGDTLRVPAADTPALRSGATNHE